MGVNAATGDLVRAARSVLGDLEAEDAAQEGLVVPVVMTVTISFLLDRSAAKKTKT